MAALRTTAKAGAAMGIAASMTVLALFARTVFFGHIGIDDAAYTFRNPFVAGGITLSNIVEAFSNLRHGGIWMPVTYISYMFDASFCRATGLPLPGWMHFTNALLHVANFLLLWRFIGVVGNGEWGSAFAKASADKTGNGDPPSPRLLWTRRGTVVAGCAAMIWAVHPLCAEPVAWIAARKELLWSFFAISGLLAISCGRFRWSVVFCAFACLSKPTAVCFPILALMVYFRKRDRQAGRLFSPAASVCFFAFFLIAAVTAAIAAYSQTHVAGQDSTALFAAPFTHRAIGALSALGYYIRAAFLPYGLHIDCRSVPGIWPLGAGWNFAALAVAAIAFFFVKAGNRRFAALWFFVSLAPTLGILGSFGIEAHADRFAYLPSMAFAILIADTVLRPKLLILPILILSALAFRQLGFWKDDATAYNRALACDPGHPRAMVHAADALCSRKRDFDGGIALYRKALSLADAVPEGGFDVRDATARLAYALASRGMYGDYREVVRLGADTLRDPSLDRKGMMLDALGTAFMADCDFKRAALLFEASLRAPARFWPKASTRRKLEECMALGTGNGERGRGNSR